MGKGGRRGSLNWQLEAIISLVLLALFAYASYTYIAANANGEAFFSRFYAVDLATSAELVSAGYGDVLLRYDNIRDDLDLSFWPENGQIAVGRPLPVTQTPGREVQTRHYGEADRYPVDTPLHDPVYLALRKVGASVGITPGETPLAQCPAVSTKAVPVERAAVYFDADASATAAFRRILQGTKIRIVDREEDATIVFRAAFVGGGVNKVSIAPSSEDALSVACDFVQQLRTLSLVEFETMIPAAAGTRFTIDITVMVRNDASVTPEQVGQAAAQALVRYY